MHTEHPRRRSGGHAAPAAITVAMAMATTSMPAFALSGAAVSSTRPGTAVSSLQAGTATARAAEPRAARNDNDIDRFMQRVLANRDAAPWRRLGDFVLRETCSVELDAPPESRLSGFLRVREYEWYVRNETAVRSPVRVDGRRHRRRDATRLRTRRGCATRSDGAPGCRRAIRVVPRARNSSTRDTPSPDSSRTSSTSWSGRWSRASTTSSVRETVAGREVVRIEFYPTGPFSRGGRRTNQSGRRQDLDGDAVGGPRDSPDSEVLLRERGARLSSVSMAPAGRRPAGGDGAGARPRRLDAGADDPVGSAPRRPSASTR